MKELKRKKDEVGEEKEWSAIIVSKWLWAIDGDISQIGVKIIILSIEFFIKGYQNMVIQLSLLEQDWNHDNSKSHRSLMIQQKLRNLDHVKISWFKEI